MIYLKDSVRFKILKPEIYGLFSILDEIYKYFGADLWITSASDGTHMVGSKHYRDEALDLRTRDLKSDANKKAVREMLQHKLGGDYDVLLENLGTPNEHIHIEWDPKL